MKANVKHDIAIQVRHQEREEEAPFAPFYRGIYSVSLNYLTHVMFIPSFARRADNWPPTLPENVDDIHSVDEARLFTAALSDYTITPDAELAGQQELILLSPTSEMGSNMGLVFYVTPQEFIGFSTELSLIEEKTIGVYDYVPISQISHFACINFIVKHLLRVERDWKVLQTVSPVPNADQIRCLVPSDEPFYKSSKPILAQKVLNGDGQGPSSFRSSGKRESVPAISYT